MTSSYAKGKSLVQYISWNTKGLNNAVKRGRVLTHLKSSMLKLRFYRRLT
uniref:Uncharacterized protein n=1 Tax=Anguilla anguilla TaxID=7936 RepID=A0A0E9VJI2_ANGAN